MSFLKIYKILHPWDKVFEIFLILPSLFSFKDNMKSFSFLEIWSEVFYLLAGKYEPLTALRIHVEGPLFSFGFLVFEICD